MLRIGKYSVCPGFVVLNENEEVVEWFDTEEEADACAEELDENDND